jgi:hypothetical protein
MMSRYKIPMLRILHAIMFDAQEPKEGETQAMA